MTIKQKKGLGLLGKMILFSLVPSYLIAGGLVYLYDRDLKEILTQQFIEETLSASSAVQMNYQYTDLIERPSLLNPFLKQMIEINPDFQRISIYANVDGEMKTVASTDPEQIGKVAGSHDSEPLLSGQPMFEEEGEGDLRALKVITPFLDEGRVVGTIGFYGSATGRDALVAHLTTRISWIVLSGCALVLLAAFFVVHRVLLTPLRILTKGSGALARGDLDLRLPVRGRDEISHLTESFNTMASSLEGKVEELTRTERNLKQKTSELIRSNADLEQFAYVASHDLQEPLRMVASYTQLLGKRYKGRLDADADDFIAYAVDGATRMQGLINDLLSYSRVGSLGKPLILTDTQAVLNQSLRNLKKSLEDSGAEVTHDPLPSSWVDPTQLEQLFQNLVGNAIKYRGKEAPRIHISAEKKDSAWFFSVRDNGMGIHPDHSERIFMIFQRLHSRESHSGTGIGLAICKKIVERHGGRIWVESKPEMGSTFYFTIPTKAEEITNHES